MILVGNQRGGAKDLANHLIKQENDLVEVHDVRGFATTNLHEALQEAYAISRATQCKQFLYSLSLNPPKDANVSNNEFEAAIDKAEKKLGLDNQPRTIVFHEKNGRRHAHAVWSRIDHREMKAIRLSFTKNKLQEVARELYLEHGWQMPRGFARKGEANPTNYTLAEYQQAKRAQRDPRQIKASFQDAWATSDSRQAFKAALDERGYKLAKGDRRGFVAVDHKGEVYAVAKWIGVKTKEVKARLGSPEDLPTIPQATASFAQDMQHTLTRLKQELKQEHTARMTHLGSLKTSMEKAQHEERDTQKQTHTKRQAKEQLARQARYRNGLLGLWDRVSGTHAKITKENTADFNRCAKRDSQETTRLAFRHSQDKQRLDMRTGQERAVFKATTRELTEDRDAYKRAETEARTVTNTRMPQPTTTQDPSERKKRRSRGMRR